MKAFTVENRKVQEGIAIRLYPDPHIILGPTRNPTKVVLWGDMSSFVCFKKDRQLIMETPMIVSFTTSSEKFYHIDFRKDPQSNDNYALVLWRISSGYRGKVQIASSDAVMIAKDIILHSPKGTIGETVEVIAILGPEEKIQAECSGRGVPPRLSLFWDGGKISVTPVLDTEDIKKWRQELDLM